MTAQVVWSGDEEAARDMRRWADQLAGEVARDAAPFGARVADLVAARVPVLSGQLAQSVTSAPTQDGVGVGYDGSTDYAGWIDFGGSRGRAYISTGRYLYPTAQAAADEFGELAERTSEKTVRSYPW